MQPPIWKKFVNVSGFAERNRSAIADENRRLREEEQAGPRAKSGIGTVRFDLGGGVYDERDAEELEDDPVYGGIATEALFKKELKTWRDQADSIDLELSDPSKPRKLTESQRAEILAEGAGLQEDNPRHAELKNALMTDEEIQAKEKAKWEAKKRLQELGQMGVNGYRQQRVQSRLSEAAKASQAIAEQEQTIAAREAEGVKGRDLPTHAQEKAQVMQQKQVVETQKQSAAGAILADDEAKKLAEWQSMKPDQRLAKKLQDSKLFSGVTQSIGIASDKSLVRRPDGSWDTPAVVKQYDNQILNTVKSGLTAVRAKAGLRGGGTAEETQAMNEALYQFQQENNLSDEEVVKAWNDFTARNNESWQDDEKLRVLSDGEIVLNASAPEILDRKKLEQVIQSANAPDEQKARALENLEFTRKNVAEQRMLAYEAAGVGIESPSEYAARTNRDAGVLNNPDFILEYEQNVINAEGEVAKKARGLAADVVLGFNKLATTVLGAGAQMTNSETLGQMAAAGSEGGQVVGEGKPDTGLAGAVVQEAPSLAAMVVGAELIGVAGAAAGAGATAMTWVSRAGSLAMAGGQSLGATYADERAQGKSHEEAEEVALRSGLNTAIITGVFNALPGMSGFEKYTGGAQKKVADVTMRDILKSTSKQELAAQVSKFARDKVLAGVSEGLEEGIDELTNAFINAKPDTNLSTAWKNAVEAAKVGALIGTGVDVIGSTGFGNREKINAAVVAAGGAEVSPEEERKLAEIAGGEVDPETGSKHVLAMREIDEISADAPELALRASGSLKIARGATLDELTTEEITALGVDRTGKALGGEMPAMVEVVNGRPILLDAAIRELETAAPSSRGLISMTEGEARQKFAKQKFTVTSKDGAVVEVEARNEQEASLEGAKQFKLGDPVDTVTPVAATGGAVSGKTPAPIAATPAGAKPSQPVASPTAAPVPVVTPAAAVVDKIRAKSKGMAKLITVSSDPAVRVVATEKGIFVNPDALMAEAQANGLDDKQSAEWVGNVIDEEVRHMAQYRAAESLWKKSKSGTPYEAWRDAHYGAMWESEFVATGKAEIVRKLYGEDAFDALAPWQQAMEGIRMMWQQNASQSQTEVAKLWTRVTEKVLAELKAILEQLKALAKDDALSPQMKRELALLQKKLKEIESPPAEKPAAKPTPQPFTVGQRIEGTVHKDDGQLGGQKISGVIAQVTPSGEVLLVNADGIPRPVRVLAKDAKTVEVKASKPAANPDSANKSVLTLADGTKPNDSGVFVGDVGETLKYKSKKASASITVMQLSNGQWIAGSDFDHNQGSHSGYGGSASIHSSQHSTREKAIQAEAERIVKMQQSIETATDSMSNDGQRAEARKIIEWAKSLIPTAGKGQPPAQKTAEKPASPPAASVPAGQDSDIVAETHTFYTPNPDAKVVAHGTVKLVSAAELERMVLADVSANQARLRTGQNANSEAQIAKIAANPKPNLLLGVDSSVSEGAPTVYDGDVLAGNGRSMGIIAAYKGGKADGYKRAAIAKAKQLGIQVDEAIADPVLIRFVTRFEGGTAQDFADQSNSQGMLGLSAVELAKIDAQVLGDFSAVETTAAGDFTAATIRDVAAAFDKDGRNKVTRETNGQPNSKQVADRIRNAALAGLFDKAGKPMTELLGVMESDEGARLVSMIAANASRLMAMDQDLSLAVELTDALIEVQSGLKAVAAGTFKSLRDWQDNQGSELIGRTNITDAGLWLADKMIEAQKKPSILKDLFAEYLADAEIEQQQRNEAAQSNDIFGEQRAPRNLLASLVASENSGSQGRNKAKSVERQADALANQKQPDPELVDKIEARVDQVAADVGFSLESVSAEQLEAEAKAKQQKDEIAARQGKRLEGGAGDLTADMFGSTEGETPLFNERRDIPKLTAEEEKAKKDVFDAFDGLIDGLQAAPLTPNYRATPPADRLPAFQKAAQSLIDAGVNSPESLAAFLGKIAGDKLRPYSEFLWRQVDSFLMTDGVKPDWSAIYAPAVEPAANQNPGDIEKSPVDLAPESQERFFSDSYTGPRFTYGLRNRPLSIGTAPKGYIIGSDGPPIGRARHGTIQYPRELTKDEIYDFELEVMGNDGNSSLDSGSLISGQYPTPSPSTGGKTQSAKAELGVQLPSASSPNSEKESDIQRIERHIRTLEYVISQRGSSDLVKKQNAARLAELKEALKKTKSNPLPDTAVESTEESFDLTSENSPLKAKSAASSRIEDFGQKILGARKDMWGSFKQALGENVPENVADMAISKMFPEPDYEAAIEQGISADSLATYKAIRDGIPAKPRKGYKLERWAEMIRGIHPLMQKLANGDALSESEIEVTGRAFRTGRLGDKIKLYQRLGFPAFQKAGDWDIISGVTMFFENGIKLEQPVVKVVASYKGRYMEITSRKTGEDGYTEVLDSVREKIIADMGKGKSPSAKSIDFKIYSDRLTKDIFIGKKAVNGVVRMKTGFTDAKSARQYLADNKADLEEQWKGMGAKPDYRRQVNAPRQGPVRRDGDATPEMFQDVFGFRGVQFGNWVENDRRQVDINEAFDAFMDLADALEIPPRAVSLDGSLGLAFGARGRAGAAAHYEPGHVVINLTKMSGPGALAHEWFHAFDNYFARFDITGETKAKPLDQFSSQRGILPKHMRPEVWKAFKGIRDILSKGAFAERSKRLDDTKSKPYYQTIIEKAARAFERYTVDRLEGKEISNDYLVNINKDASEALPTKKEMDEGIREAYDNLFNILETKITDTGTALQAAPLSSNYTYREVTSAGFTQYIVRAANERTGKMENRVFDTKAEAQAEMDRIDELSAPATDDDWSMFRSSLAAAPLTPFYSGLARVIDEKLPKVANAGQVMQIAMQNAKAEEVKWSGLQQALVSMQDEKGKVTKEAVLEYLANEGMVRFEEVDSSAKNRYSDGIKELPDGTFRAWATSVRGFTNDEFETRDEAIRWLDARVEEGYGIGDNEPGENTKYSQYTLPGGENYREVVLAMPNAGFEEWLKKNGVSDFSKLEAGRQRAMIDDFSREKGLGYTSSHFPDVPNYVAHMRVDERTLPDGKRTMHAAEYQSDRHQAGRKQGYKGEANVVDTIDKLTRDQAIKIIQMNERGNDTLEGDEDIEDLREAVRGYLDNEGEDESGETFRFLKNLAGTDGVADAPFRTTWPIALFKRHLRDAVVGGFDAVSWDTGETQNDRFDLSKQVDSVNYDPFNKRLIAVKDGNRVIDESGVSKEKLLDYVGKDVADRLIQPDTLNGAGNHVLSGDGLKVGGSGMKGFYDNMLPKEISKYVKQWGGKVEKGELLNRWVTDFEAENFGDKKSTPIWRVDITEAMRKGVSSGQSLFAAPLSPNRDAEYLAAVQSGDMETARRMVDEAARIEGERAVFEELELKLFGDYPDPAKVFKKINESRYTKGLIPVPVIYKQTGINGQNYAVRALAVKRPDGQWWVFYSDSKKRVQSVTQSDRYVTPAGIDPLSAHSHESIAKQLRKQVPISTEGLKITGHGINWWSTLGDMGPTTLGKLVDWPFLKANHPDILEIKVRPGVPGEGAGWVSAATSAGYQHLPDRKYKEGTEIIINPNGDWHDTVGKFIRTLAHEATHLYQAKVGSFVSDSLHSTEGYASSPIEVEAKQTGNSIPLQPWPTDKLGEIQESDTLIESLEVSPLDPVTYDEAGNVIPLSRRFNPASNSILEAAPLMNEDRIKEIKAQQDEFGNAVKPPNRASVGDETTRKAVDVFDIEYEERREKETRQQWVDRGTDLAKNRRKELIENAKANAYGEVGAVPLRPEDIVGTQIVIEQMVKEANGSYDKLIDAGVVIQAYRTMRSNVARVLASGWDRTMKPEERNRRFLANAILTLPPKVAAAVARKHLSPSEAKAEMRRELQERLTKIDKALKEYGVTVNEVLNKQVYLSLDKKNIVKDIMRDSSKDEALAIRMHQQNADAAKIAKACHMTVDEVQKLVKRVYDEAMARMIEKARAGMTLETSGLQAASLLTEDQIMAEARRMVEIGLGISPTVHTPSTRALARKARVKVESAPEKINWARPEFNDGLNGYTFNDKDLAEIKRTTQALIDATAATAKVETLTGKKRQEADAMLAKIESILAKYGTSVQQVVESGKPLESYRFDITDRVHVHLIANAIRSVDADAIDKGVEWYYFSMLSGLQTMMVNASSVVHGIFDATIGRGAEMILNAFLRNPMNASLGETKYILKAMGPMMSRARSNFAASYGAEAPFFEQDILGVPPDLESVLEGHGMYHRTAISGKKGQFIRIPTRVLLATDEFVKTINAMTEVGAMAYRICRAADLKPGTAAFDDKMKELVNVPGSLAWQMAASKAYNRTFTNALPGQKDPATGNTRETRTVGEVFGNIVGKTQGLLQSGPSDTMTAKLGKTMLRLMFFPFVKVPYNITALAMTYTPLSLIDIATLYAQSRGIKGKAEKQKAQAEVIERMSRVMLGGILAGFMLGAGEGDDDDLDKPLLITGSRPYKDTKKGVRELGQRMGVDAYSISWKLPNGKRGVFHYGRIEPVATLLATTIDTMRELKQSGRGRQDYGEAMTKAVSSFTNQLSDKTFLKGIGDAYKTVMGEQNMSKFVADKLAMAVPNLIKQPIRETDPYFRDKADTFGEELLSAIYPSGIREPKVDIYGDKSTKLGNSLTRIFDFTDAGTVTIRKVDEMLWRYQQMNPDASGIPTIASDKYTPVTGEGQKEMTETQARMYRERAGQNLTNMLKSRTFNYTNPTERDIDNLNKLIDAARKSAKAALKYDPNWK